MSNLLHSQPIKPQVTGPKAKLVSSGSNGGKMSSGSAAPPQMYRRQRIKPLINPPAQRQVPSGGPGVVKSNSTHGVIVTGGGSSGPQVC